MALTILHIADANIDHSKYQDQYSKLYSEFCIVFATAERCGHKPQGHKSRSGKGQPRVGRLMPKLHVQFVDEDELADPSGCKIRDRRGYQNSFAFGQQSHFDTYRIKVSRERPRGRELAPPN